MVEVVWRSWFRRGRRVKDASNEGEGHDGEEEGDADGEDEVEGDCEEKGSRMESEGVEK